MKLAYEENITRFTDLFNNIEYVDPSENYDRFCEINKINEKRKSLASFYFNLMVNGIILKSQIIAITRNLLNNVYNFILIDNKKNEVDELTENIAIVFNKDIIEEFTEERCIDGNTVIAVITILAKCKVKEYPSLSNKTIFKCMDLVEI